MRSGGGGAASLGGEERKIVVEAAELARDRDGGGTYKVQHGPFSIDRGKDDRRPAKRHRNGAWRSRRDDAW
jgi:hypothetical protein